MALVRGSANFATHGFVPIHFSAKIPVKLDNVCVFVDCCNRDWESEFEGGGDVARIREFGDIAVNDWTVDGTTSYETISETYQDIVIDQQKYFAFKVDKVDLHQADIGVLDAYEERAAIKMRNVVDTHLGTAIATAVPVDNTIGATTLGSVIQLNPANVYAVCCDLKVLLEESNTDSVTDEMPWLTVPPVMVGMMRKSGQLTPATDMGDIVIRKGVVGEFAGFQVKKHTNYSYTAASGGNDDYINITGGFNFAHSFAMQIQEVEGPFVLQTTFGKAVRGLGVYGSKGVVAQGLCKGVFKF